MNKKYNWGEPDPSLVKKGIVYCPKCGKNPAIVDKQFGVLDCQECKKKYIGPANYPEFTTEKVKEERKQYFNSALQPWRGGIASKEFIEAFPNHAKRMFTKKEIRKSKYVWRDLPGWRYRNKSK